MIFALHSTSLEILYWIILDASYIGFFDTWISQVKLLCIMCRFAVAEGKLRKLMETEGRSEILCSGSRQLNTVQFSAR